MGNLPARVEHRITDPDGIQELEQLQLPQIKERRHQNVPSFYIENLNDQDLEAMDASVQDMHEILKDRGVTQEKIDAITPIGYRTTILEDGSKKEHLLLEVEHNGFTERIWRSAPAHGKAVPGAPVIVTKPGLGEKVQGGIGWSFHEAISIKNPETTVITHASHSSQGTDAMAEACLDLLNTYFPDEKFIFIGTSMGSKIMTTMLAKNLQTPKDERIEVDGFILFASAVVPPQRVPMDMGVRFMKGMVLGLAKEVLFKTKKEEREEYFKMLTESMLSGEELRGVARHIIDLVKGSPRYEIESVVRHYKNRMMVISGSEDSLRQSRMWHDLGVRFIPIKGRGHEAAVKPVAAAKKISKEMRKSGWLLHNLALAS
jgi:pimeloyl-ACP methyl ester carboxylesterase